LIKPTKLKPHFTEETTRDKVKAAQDAWNIHNHELVTQAYAIDSRWRNMIVFLRAEKQLSERRYSQ
jgi:uncharacterized protein